MPDDQGRPFLYLDTNVLLDVVDSRRRASGQLLDRIKSEEWSALTSPFTLLEMYEAKQADRWAEKLLSSGLTFSQIQRRVGERCSGRSALNRGELDEVYSSLYAAMQTILDTVVFPELTPGLQNKAEEVCASTNLDPTDSFHLATALYYGCDILVTSDSTFLKLARPYMIANTPDGFDRALVQYRQVDKS